MQAAVGPPEVPVVGDIQPILDYVACFEEISGSSELNAQVYHSLAANRWRTTYALSDPDFDSLVFPSLEADVVSYVPEAAQNAVRYALKRASRALAAKLSLASGASAAAGGAGASASLVGLDAGSVSSTSQTTGEPRAKSGAMSFVTKDGIAITVQKTTGAIDRISANQHWIRIWGIKTTRYNHFLGENVELGPGDMAKKLDIFTHVIQSGFPPWDEEFGNPEWKSMNRLSEMRELRFMGSADKLDRFIAFEWSALFPLQLSITDFVADDTVIDCFNETQTLQSTRSALQRGLGGLALALYVFVGYPRHLFELAFDSMMTALQGEMYVDVPDIYFIYLINAAVARVMYCFKYESPESNRTVKFTEPGALLKALDMAMATSVLKLPTSGSQYDLRGFENNVLPLLRKNRGVKTAAKAADTSSDSGDAISKTSRKRGSRGKGAKRATADSQMSTDDKTKVVVVNSKGGAIAQKKSSGAASQSKSASQPVTPCPYFLAEQLGVTLRNNAARLISCNDKGKCDRGQHVALTDVTRAEAVELYSTEPVASYHVGSEARRIIGSLPDSSFKK